MPTLDQASRASAATVPMHRGALARSTIISWTLRVGTAAALGTDAVVHWQNASAYDAVTATISQGELFRVEAAVAVAVGLLVLLWPRRGSWVAALGVGASALAAVCCTGMSISGRLARCRTCTRTPGKCPANCYPGKRLRA